VLIERLRQGTRKATRARAAVFDFDGTLVLIRAGWMPVMLDMMMETLAPLGPDASILRVEAEEYVARFTGRDTLIQMEAFAEHIQSLGGTPLAALEYKREFARRIRGVSEKRLDAVRTGALVSDGVMVPGARALLEELRSAGVRTFLASGTAHEVVVQEAELLGIADYFEAIHGSAPGMLSKRDLLARLLDDGLLPDEVITFGDGRVEIEAARAIDGIAVGVATDEPECVEVDPKKRGWLRDAGADFIIPNYLETGLLATVAGIG
jgi:phosphoglycolate phosphatase-like HAD superfamily hydrolase